MRVHEKENPGRSPVSGLKNRGAVCKEGKGFGGVQCRARPPPQRTRLTRTMS